jgi:hypothetical protein
VPAGASEFTMANGQWLKFFKDEARGYAPCRSLGATWLYARPS